MADIDTALRKLAIAGFVIMALAVTIGAFGAHGLGPRISGRYLDIYKTGNFYHFIHGLAILIVIQYNSLMGLSATKRICWLFIGGIVLFSGSLYILSLWEIFESPGLRKMGAITPIGGILFIAGWLQAGWAVYSSKRD